jgi:hypothetical protein
VRLIPRDGADMHRYTTKHEDDLRLGAPYSPSKEGWPCDTPLREWLAVLDERLRQVVSSVGDLANRMDLLAKQNAEVPVRLGVTDMRMNGIDCRFDAVENRLCGVEGRLSGVETRLSGVEGRLSGVETRLSGVEGRLSGVETRLSGVEGRLGIVEERLTHTATKTWVLGCAVALLLATLSGTLGGVWWILQQYIGPLLRASAG